MKIGWKELYNENRKRRFSEIKGIKKEGVIVESSTTRFLRDRYVYIILVLLLIIGASLYVFRYNFKLAWAVIGFFILAGAGFFAFNNYKLECTKDGLAMKFGLQQGTFKYERIKSIYISRFNETSYFPSLMNYNIVVRYVDNFNRIKELFFDAAFLDKEQVKEFLDNFEIEDKESTKFANFERWKIIRRVGKVVLIVLFIILFGLVGYFYK